MSGVVLPLAVLFFVLLFSSSGFLSAYNIVSVLQSVALFVLVGLAQISALALGQFNLAVGSMGCLSAILMGFLMEVLGVSPFISFFLGIVIAVALGMLQGVLVAKSGISPFIITLALLSVYEGLATIITTGNSYKQLPSLIKTINRAKIGAYIPVTFLIALSVCVFAFLLFRYTNVGKRLQAVGANRQAALFSGINVSATIVMGHALSGFFAGCAAIIQICKFNSAQLSIGSDWMMNSFVVAVLGGTLLSGGKVTVLGTLLGSFLMVYINNALGLWRVNTYAFQAIMGMVLLGAYEIDRMRVSLISRQGLLTASVQENLSD